MNDVPDSPGLLDFHSGFCEKSLIASGNRAGKEVL
jgi:hypothetical protein